MATTPAGMPPHLPWTDRGSQTAPPESPRSQRDVELLRGLARRINPQDAGAHNNLGVVYYNKGLYDEAITHFERALELDPRMQVAERNLQICYFGTGHLEQLKTSLERRLAVDPDDAVARDELARMHFNSGNHAAAVDELRALIRLRPEDAQLHLRMARAEQRRGDLDAALQALRRAEALDPHSARVQFMIGEVFYHRGLSREARRPLERAIVLDPSLADAHHLLAFVYGDSGEEERAVELAARAAQLNPSMGRAEAGLSLDGYSTARYQELIGGGAQHAPGVAEGGELAHYNLGLAFRQKALYDEALREFRLARERGEDTFLVQQAQAEMLLLRGGSGEALELYRELVQREPTSPKLWNELGVARHQAGELTAAEEAYRRALEIDTHYALAWNNLGIARHHMQLPNAEEAFVAAVREGQSLSDVWRNWALLLHRLDRSSESVAAYEKALAADATNAEANTGLGILLLDLNRPEEARAHLLRAVELDPEHAEARYNLAFALSALGDYQAALQETRHALELNPYIPTPRFRLLIDLQFEAAGVFAPELDADITSDAVASFSLQPGELERAFESAVPQPRRARQEPQPGDELMQSAREAMRRGLYEQASALVQRAGTLGADRMEVLLLQGEIFLLRGLSGEAVERFNAALAEITRRGADDHDDALRRALHGAARSLLDLNRMPQAVEAAERLCALAPGDVEALRTLGEALSRVHDYARAAIVLEQARTTAPRDIGVLTQLGSAYAAAGELGRAERVLRQAVETDDLAVGAAAALARVLVQVGREGEAEAQYQRALRLLPSYGEAAFGLAALYERSGRLRSAIHVMADLLTLDSYRVDALLRLSELLIRHGSPQEARFALERVLRLDPAHEAARVALAAMAGGEA